MVKTESDEKVNISTEALLRPGKAQLKQESKRNPTGKKKGDAAMRKYIADSWDSIDQYQLINDKESKADEHVRLRNLIT